MILGYTYFFKPEDRKDLEKPLKITNLFKSQKKLLILVPVITLLIVVQMVLWWYLAHIYAEPGISFIFDQSILPFNALRLIHTQLAILWIAWGWLVWGMMIAPWVT